MEENKLQLFRIIANLRLQTGFYSVFLTSLPWTDKYETTCYRLQICDRVETKPVQLEIIVYLLKTGLYSVFLTRRSVLKMWKNLLQTANL